MRVSFIVCAFTLPCVASELARCCAAGERHLRRSGGCSLISKSKSTATPFCRRAANVCCLRSMLDNKCDAGGDAAQASGHCDRRNLGRLGGGVQLECCECCLLAMNSANAGVPCAAPPGFSARCRSQFDRCCPRPVGYTFSTTSHTEPADVRLGAVKVIKATQSVDRCASTNECEQICGDRGGAEVECSCRRGFDLSANGKDCIDRDECDEEGSAACDGDFDRCVNTLGSYTCLADPADPICPDGYRLVDGRCTDENECHRTPAVCRLAHQECMNTPGSYHCHCAAGFTWNARNGTCVDVDECLLLADSCTDSQRCLNTPGSFKCIRTLSCGTGYYVSSDDDQNCLDIDECTLGSHNCGVGYECRNTRGSFRCETRRCDRGSRLDRRTGQCESINCPQGFEVGADGSCRDVDECLSPYRCRSGERCVNSVGSFTCTDRSDLCQDGYRFDDGRGFCVDVNECEEGVHSCDSVRQCVNREGSFTCRCRAGFEFSDDTMRCEDVDECERFSGRVCSFHATCENLSGSFRCHCSVGFRLAPDERDCEDLDECATGSAQCEQRCVNIPGSYQCVCGRGFTLSADGRSCEDIDECSVWQGADDDLCMGGCVNTAGSYECRCPDGYELLADSKTCKDVNECQRGDCQGDERICVNTLGGYQCHQIQCPPNYARDVKFRNRCNRPRRLCAPTDSECMRQPVHVSYQLIALPRMRAFDAHTPSITLFTMRGPPVLSTLVEFELHVRRVDAAAGVRAATRDAFLLQHGARPNAAVVALRRPLDGPQHVHLELLLKMQHTGRFAGRYVANLLIYVSEYSRSVVGGGRVDGMNP